MNSSPATLPIKDWLHSATKQLESAAVGSARLDVLVLLEDELHKDRAWLLAHPDFALNRSQVKDLNTKITQRSNHIPLAYIRGKAAFYGREFFVSNSVLQPRPESETIIEILLKLPAIHSKPYAIADVGTGSGALGITAALELPGCSVVLLEIDASACKVAQKNVVNYSLSLPVLKSDLLEAAPQAYDILLCNLPYVPDDFHINTAAGHEPRLAIFGGNDGLDLYRRLFDQLQKIPKKPLYILCESLPFQHSELAHIAEAKGYKLQETNDFVQLFTNNLAA